MKQRRDQGAQCVLSETAAPRIVRPMSEWEVTSSVLANPLGLVALCGCPSGTELHQPGGIGIRQAGWRPRRCKGS